MSSADSPFSLTGKRYAVTGAASGIGRATSIILSRLGAKLVLIDRDLEGLNLTSNECRNANIVPFDLRNSAGIKDMLLDATAEGRLLDGFVHLAGVPYISPLKSINESKYTEVLQINTFAALELAKAFINKKISVENSRSIVFISSVYASVGSEANVGYAMSKAALHGVTKSLAIELAPKKIRVNCIAPGFVTTAMMQNTEKMFTEKRNEILASLHPLGLGDADDVGHACAFLLSDAAKWITGSIMHVDGGFTAK